MGRPTKYDTVVLPRLDWIKRQAEQGIPESDIYGVLGVSKQTWSNWKKNHPELLAFFDLTNKESERQKAIDERIQQVKDALFRRATGYEYDEVKEYITEKDGKQTKHKEVVHKILPPDPMSIHGYLNIYDDTYSKDNSNRKLREKEIAIKERDVEIREKLANMSESDDNEITINITRKSSN